MRLVMITVLVAGSFAFAQRPGGPPGRAIRGGGFSGGVIYPGAGSALGSRTGTRYYVPPPAPHPVHAGTAIVPYPVYYGGYYYGYDPSLGYAQPAPGYSADPGYSSSPSQAPVVLMNPGYVPDSANPQIRDYSNSDLPEPGPGYAPQRGDPQATIYLIALTDHNILPAIAYWVDGDTLNYITQDGTQNRLSLALVDRDFSKKLNDDRGVEFRLPVNK